MQNSGDLPHHAVIMLVSVDALISKGAQIRRTAMRL
jgi:hypothetical protein